ncbi:hypothetical protein PY247_11275 [Acinetobacter proteolyticus]|uniref:hypothetical protein n=1 Tax=Acinetobacter higginsii TaxID=70347 RepID=UPI0023BAF7AC|nr:hypothetical protein [Acinetobacter proteolyticus]WEI17142.1 hypothetical protein PY247_11275 [Acinetobacter proteolyticus]
MLVKFLDVVHITNTLYKAGDIGEFPEMTAGELIDKGLAEAADDSESTESADDKKQNGRQSPKSTTPAQGAK